MYFLNFPGYFCDIVNSPVTTYSPYPCPVGYYCPNGTESSTHHPCPAGTYNPYTKLQHVSECTACDAGKYCGTNGLSVVSGELTKLYFGGKEI